MRTRGTWRFAVGIAFLIAVGSPNLWAGMDLQPPPEGLSLEAVSEDPAVAKAAIIALRRKGPNGLRELILPYQRLIYARSHGNFVSDERTAIRDAHWARLAAAIDAVAAQKDAAYSRLYWYTDMEQAKAAAAATGRPILSLRLLGTLDTEFSCANSRYFRTVLYANAEVSAALGQRFVLHWQSVRPVPKVTIDMGDGRVIERTITGNSAHYVLDAHGRPVDVVPGLYGPKAFLRALGEAERAVRGLDELPDDMARRGFLRDWHGARLRAVTEQWEKDLAQVRAEPAVAATSAQVTPAAQAQRRAPTAVQAARAAVGKSVAEFNIVRALAPRVAVLREGTDDAAWAAIAVLPAHAQDAKLDPTSVAVMRSKQHPAARDAGARAPTKRRTEDPLLRVVAAFERSVAEDTVRNEYGFHRTIHEWFAEGRAEAVGGDLGVLNERVYAELFLTPSSDPWLGLAPADAYSALAGDGIVRKD